MKPKHLIVLAAILVVLAGLVFMRQQQQQPPSIEEQYTLKQMLPQDIDKTKIAKIELYAGAKPDQKLVLERTGEGEKWKIASKWDAPVAQAKIDEFLATLENLEGEFRAAASGDALKSYSVDDEGGFHVIGYTAGTAEPAFHIVSGKSPQFETAFARLQGSEDVYHINVSLRREVGIYTVEMGDAPEHGIWLDKTVFETPSDKIKAVALSYPDKEISFELREKPKAAEAPAETPAEGEAAPAAAPAQPEFEWAVASGGPETDFNTNAGANLARRLSRINATDVMDPAMEAALGLAEPKFRATVTIDGQAEPVVIEASRPAGDTFAYIQIAGRAPAHIYKVNGFDFEQIFHKGGEFFELPGVLVDQKEVDTIEYTLGGRTIQLAREDQSWKIVGPKTDLAADPATIDDLVRTLISWKAEDYADSPEGKGLEAPADRVTFRGPNVAHTIELGGGAPTEGRYARLDGRPRVLVMSAADVDAIFAEVGDLFQTRLFDVDSSAISKVTLNKGDAVVRIERNADDTGWLVAIGDGAVEPADDGNVEEVIASIAGLDADDFDFSEVRTMGNVLGTIAFTKADGTEQPVTVENPSQGNLYPVTKAGVNAVYLVPGAQIESIFVDPATLKPAPAPAEEIPAAAQEAPPVESSADADTAPAETPAEAAAPTAPENL